MTIREQREGLRSELRQQFPRERANLLPALHFLHRRYGHLPAWAMEVVGWHLRIPASQVYGAATSYTELRTKAPGKHLIRVCTGVSCWLRGGGQIVAGLSASLKVAPGETTSDGEYTLEETPCAFLCAVAPVVERDHHLVGRISVDALADLVRSGPAAAGGGATRLQPLRTRRSRPKRGRDGA